MESKTKHTRNCLDRGANSNCPACTEVRENMSQGEKDLARRRADERIRHAAYLHLQESR